MNNRYFSLLTCILVLAITPACKKSHKNTSIEKIKTTIELDSPIIEIEKDNEQHTIVKF